MLKIFKAQSHFILIVISLLLLASFLGYFLKTEFAKEEESIKLEKRNYTFESFFAQIDTFSNHSKTKTNGSIVTWLKDSTGSRVKYHLKITTDSLHKPKTTYKLSARTENRSPENLRETWLKKETKHRHEGSDSLILIVPDLKQSNDTQSSKNRFPSLLEHKYDKTRLDVIKMKKGNKKPFFGLVEEEVPKLAVFKRMLPQILFSLLLLLCIGLTFILITRTLRKERQLAGLRNDFMSNMSHELKTPVSTIGVALEALSNFDAGNNPELRREYIHISKMEAERLGLLVDKALNISLYEQGKFVYDKTNIDINEEIKKVLKTLKVQLDNQNVELYYDTRGSNFFINVDRTHMVNVIYNLIENAIKYSEGHAEIDIVLTEKERDIEIIIADKGRGIAPEYQDKIFDKFFRVPQGNMHNVKGHGLGLSYVKEVVESLGGSIFLKSGIEAGTTFIIKMPKSMQV